MRNKVCIDQSWLHLYRANKQIATNKINNYVFICLFCILNLCKHGLLQWDIHTSVFSAEISTNSYISLKVCLIASLSAVSALIPALDGNNQFHTFIGLLAAWYITSQTIQLILMTTGPVCSLDTL
jgi:hypothetical protein